ncbi:hypothetical protein NEOLEDRAFT_1213685 [Neolentinus lepideus HHB14362 ss-1]|uniref:C2H2-type domain-containing protein n=1 Tax=Neolentinus lepideus HHB14362 ss-1 TaxID=1314782 RepID=A0A165QZD4_9AGAM|nr:hypothetical protein NEOLEDRAFT_1213685 [Neolentinus lepideus HHB14362 ss-1]
MNPYGDTAEDPFLLLDDQERDNFCGPAQTPYYDNRYLAAVGDPGSAQSYMFSHSTQQPDVAIPVQTSETFVSRNLNVGDDVYASDDGMLSPNIMFTPADSEFPPSPQLSSHTPLSEPDVPWPSSSPSEGSFLAASMQNMRLRDLSSDGSIGQHDHSSPNISFQGSSQLTEDWSRTVYTSQELSLNMSATLPPQATLGHRHSISIPNSQYLSPPVPIDRRRHSRSVSQDSPFSASRQSSRRSSPYPSPQPSPRLGPQSFEDDNIDSLSPSASLYSHPSTSAESLSSSSSVLPPANVQRQQVTSRAIKEASESRRTSDARFTCEVEGCGQTFTRLSNLRGHYTAHSGERPYECDQADCDRKFARSSDLSRHLRNVHKIGPSKKTQAPP